MFKILLKDAIPALLLARQSNKLELWKDYRRELEWAMKNSYVYPETILKAIFCTKRPYKNLKALF